MGVVGNAGFGGRGRRVDGYLVGDYFWKGLLVYLFVTEYSWSLFLVVGDTLAATRSDIRSRQDHSGFRQRSRCPSGRSIPEKLAIGDSIRSTRQRRRVGLIPQA
jgi:hypothetical protein